MGAGQGEDLYSNIKFYLEMKIEDFINKPFAEECKEYKGNF